MTSTKLTLALTAYAAAVLGQNAQLSGLIQDPSALKVSGAEISVRNEQTGGRRSTNSNDDGFYSVFSLSPGVYRISVHANGFETIIREGIKLDVGANARVDFNLRIGDSHTEVTVLGGPPLINTEDASVGTVIDRDIIDQMPLNGRGIQSLIELTPGVVVVPVTDSSRGQFAINGQRSDANYFTVDGVSANFGAGDAPLLNKPILGLIYTVGQAGGGMLPANNFLGTFSNLVSPDALQEFKIQTSTFAPEFGRSPGAQIGLITRSGGNRYSGSLFEYFRNDKTDANNWFANQQGTPKPPLRFNNFGGTLGGPVRIPHLYDGHNRTFFFLSVEDLVAVQPQFLVALRVPTLQVRQSAPASVASLLNAFPLPNRTLSLGGDPAVTGVAQFVGTYSLRQDQQTYGLRIDHSLTDKVMLFARYNAAPSQSLDPTANGPLSNIQTYAIKTEMLTGGLTQTLTPNLVNEIRLNGSRQSADVTIGIDNTGGAKSPPDALLFPAGYSSNDSSVAVGFIAIPDFTIGLVSRDRARQLQVVDRLSWSMGAHQFKFGLDDRWFSPSQTTPRSSTRLSFNGLYGTGGALNGVVPIVNVAVPNESEVAYVVKAFSAYAQDSWRASRRLTLTYGIRWEIDPAPRVSAGQAEVLAELTSLSDISSAHAVAAGRPFYPTTWSNFAPRIGAGWQLLNAPARKTVLRAGAGRFFDLAQAGFADTGSFTATVSSRYENQPLGSIATGSPLSVTQTAATNGFVAAAPGYNLPSTYEWNVTLEQSIGPQTFSVGYVGALGRGLIGYFGSIPGAGSFSPIQVLGNDSTSSYNALQLQFNRRLSGPVRLLLSYTWAHSIDNLSNDLAGIDDTRSLTQYFNPNIDRGSSDFDIRHSLNGSLMAALPAPRNRIAAIMFRNWSANSIFFARSALPTDILDSNAVPVSFGFRNSGGRPNLVPGQPLYLYGSGYPGGKSYNAAAFSNPPPGTEGNLGRNVLRGFGAWQIDFALHRNFRLSERTGLQFRAEAFNILNHPNFANPSDAGDPEHLTLVQNSSFGTSTAMLANGLASTGVPGQLNPLFQIGGPRSMQFALRLSF